MIIIRKNHERGHSQTDWLTSSHTFSFADYFDPQFMGFGTLRVINEDIVQAGMGFGRHPHNNMEIISYVIEGEIEHKDSMGNGSIIKPGEIQRMSAGVGITHSEFNPSDTEQLHFLQIWIKPDIQQIPPSYEQKTIPKDHNKLILIGSKESGSNAIYIHQDVQLFVAYMNSNHSVEYEFKKGRKGWIQLIKGTINVNQNALSVGDGAAITEEDTIFITATEDAEFLLFDLS
jgi:quercetin 2,3-dioxygenase